MAKYKFIVKDAENIEKISFECEGEIYFRVDYNTFSSRTNAPKTISFEEILSQGEEEKRDLMKLKDCYNFIYNNCNQYDNLESFVFSEATQDYVLLETIKIKNFNFELVKDISNPMEDSARKNNLFIYRLGIVGE